MNQTELKSTQFWVIEKDGKFLGESAGWVCSDPDILSASTYRNKEIAEKDSKKITGSQVIELSIARPLPMNMPSLPSDEEMVKAYREYQHGTTGIDVNERDAFESGWKVAIAYFHSITERGK